MASLDARGSVFKARAGTPSGVLASDVAAEQDSLLWGYVGYGVVGLWGCGVMVVGYGVCGIVEL